MSGVFESLDSSWLYLMCCDRDSVRYLKQNAFTIHCICLLIFVKLSLGNGKLRSESFSLIFKHLLFEKQ